MSTEEASSGSAGPVVVPKGRKRRRTRSHNSASPSPGRGFYVPGFEDHSAMSLTEVMDTARGITNMYLAHEIAVDKDFMLKKVSRLFSVQYSGRRLISPRIINPANFLLDILLNSTTYIKIRRLIGPSAY